ncbi:Tetratricopeptide-like helical domain superfamily [Sesbania bispinosa]|nr:Tetratricopeptide-like helical domain superfamily [Sesbania bispinosa]
MASVYIPVQNSEEEVRVALDQLPRDASDILDILKAEQAPLDLWLIIAREYFKQGKVDQFRQILEEGSSPEIDDYYADVRYERIAILNAPGAYYSYLGKIETKQREKEEHFILATQYYNKASRIDMHEPSTWVGKGQLLLAKGEIEQASAAFKIVLDGDRDNVPALLGQACVEFNRGRFSDSLELYKRALQVYPNCPAAVRLGIGLCRYKLGQFEKAQQAFERLDPENVEALVALAIMDLRTNEAAGIRKGMGDYDKAGVYYMASVKEVNKPHEFVFPYYGLGQVQIKLGDFRSALSNFEKVLEVYPDNCETLKPEAATTRTALWSVFTLPPLHTVICGSRGRNCEQGALGHIYVQLGQTDKGQDFIRKATKIDPRDAQAFLELGELLILSDTGAALDAFKTARTLFKKGGQEVPIELLNNVGVLQFERGEFELAQQTFKEALGDGIWLSFINNGNKFSIDAATSTLQFKDMQLFHDLESNGHHVEVPWDKVTVLFNLARLLEQLNESGTASILYRLILFKVWLEN